MDKQEKKSIICTLADDAKHLSEFLHATKQEQRDKSCEIKTKTTTKTTTTKTDIKNK